MTNFARVLTSDEVIDQVSFARYAQQNLGTPMPTNSTGFAILGKKVRECFGQNPAASWGTLARLVDWAKVKHRRPANAWGLFPMVRYAWKDGMLPELDPDPVEVDMSVERGIREALRQETDEWWRRRLVGAIGVENRRAALKDWRQRGIDDAPLF